MIWRHNMKDYRIPIVALLLAALIAPTHALVLGPSLNASLLYYEPVPATPGSVLDVYVQIENNGDASGKVTVNFVDNTPFSLDSDADRTKAIESIPGQKSFLLKYKVRVSQDATPGTSFLKVEYGESGSGNLQTTLLPIDITSNTVALNIEDITLDPERFTPGGVGTVALTLRNAAPVKIKDGTVTLDLSGLSIVPIGSTNQQRFTDLQAGQQQEFTFKLAPSPDLAPGTYKLPILLNFSDQSGKNYQRTEYVGIVVGSTPSVSVTVDTSQLTAEQTTGDVILRVTNKGLGEIKFVDVTVGTSGTFDLLSGSPERYVGNIDSDDYKTARITIKANDDAVRIPVTVTYMDALNTQYTMNETLTLSVRSAKTGGGSSYLIIGIVVIVLAAGYFLWWRKRK